MSVFHPLRTLGLREMVGDAITCLSIIPALLPHLDSDRVISEDEIDAIFGLLDARALN